MEMKTPAGVLADADAGVMLPSQGRNGRAGSVTRKSVKATNGVAGDLEIVEPMWI